MTTVTCPYCSSTMIDYDGSGTVYSCPNEQCRCDDGGMTLYQNWRPIEWITRRRIKVAKLKILREEGQT